MTTRSFPGVIMLAVTLAAPANDTPAVDAGPPEVRAPDPETRYHEQIRRLTRSHGAVAFELAEQWVGLAFAQRRAGRHADAVLSLEAALHIERVHKGLHHPDQIPLLERLAESNRAIGDWGAVEQNLRLLHWINGRGRPPESPERLETVTRLAKWHLEAADLPTGRAPYAHLSEAAELAAEAVALTRRRHGPDAPELVEPLVLTAAVAHRIAHHMSTWVGEPVRGVTQEAIITTASDDPSDLLFRQNFVVSNYAAGRDALESAARLAARSGDAVGHARCEQLLGDWHLLFGRKNSASQHYDRAQALATAAGVDLFSRPRQLPNFVDLRAPAPPSDPKPVPYVKTRFDIDPQGRARNVEILEVNPPGRNVMARQARQQLREMRFRPRFQNGKAVKSEGVEIRIVFPQAEGITS